MEIKKGLSGRDLITIGIFSAIYFVINFAVMLCSALHPLIWILLPGLTALLTGIPFLMMCAKVQKPGAVLMMGLITALIYYVTGQFTIFILVTFAVSCILAEIARIATGYKNFSGNTVSFIFFSLGMTGSPLPIWLMKEEFLNQITRQGKMPADYVNTLEALTTGYMMIILFAAPVVLGFIGARIAGAMFRKHFTRAGIA